jgi:very-short-patch-repair endonuclease
MTHLYNRRQAKRRRQELRREMPRCEVILWSRLRNRQVLGVKFRRQYSVGPYVLDFYCPELKLAVEVDGDSHFGPEEEARDARRQRYIERKGIRFSRWPNDQVLHHTDWVVEQIAEVVQDLIDRRL